MQYNKNKHLKLLKSLQKSENSIKNVSDEEFLKLLDSRSDENFLELEAYSAMIICHLHWGNREQYFKLIEKLLNGPINFLQLIKKHRAINNAEEMLEAELILLEHNKKCQEFDDLMDELVSLFNRFCPDPSLRESHEFSEEELIEIDSNDFLYLTF